MSFVKPVERAGRRKAVSLPCAAWLGIALSAAASLAHGQDAWLSYALDLDNAPYAARIDAKRSAIYVSVPQDNRVFVLDMYTLGLVRKIYVGFHPTGIDLSRDGNTLYAALNLAGAVGVYDLDTDSGSEIDISTALNDSHTWDVVEAAPGAVFASANDMQAFTYVTRLDVATQGAVRDPNEIDVQPSTFARDPQAKYLYVFGNSLLQLDVTRSPATVLQRGSGLDIGYGMVLSPTGTELAFGTGTRVRTSDLTQAPGGTLPQGAPAYSLDGSEIDVAPEAAPPITVERFNSTTLQSLGTVTSSCSPIHGDTLYGALQPLPTGDGWLIVTTTSVCLLRKSDVLFANGFDA